MNKERRTKLEAIVAQLEEIKEEERAAFDALSEGLQQSEKGQAIEAAGDNLDEAISSVQAAIDGE